MTQLKCPHCKNDVEQARINAITLNGKFDVPKSLSCAKCMNSHDVSRAAGFMPSESKMQGSIVITTQEHVANYHKLSARGGVGVSKGCKMYQGHRAS